MLKQIRFVIPVTVLIMIVMGGLWISQTNFTVNAQTTSTDTAQIEERDFNVIVGTSGSITSARSLNLAFGVGGTVNTVAVEVGALVQAGDVLATLDTADLALQVELAEQGLIAQQANFNSLVDEPTALELAQVNAGVAQAQSGLASATLALVGSNVQVIVNCANLDKAVDALEQTQEAFDDYIQAGYEADPLFMPDPDSQIGRALRDAQTNFDVSTAQCDLSVQQAENTSQLEAARAALAQAEASRDTLLAGPTENQLAAAQAQLRSAEIQFQQAQDRLADAQLIAPFDGLITVVNVVEGQTVGIQNPAIVIADMSALHINVSVDELDISSIALGQIATITLDALEDVVLSGTVTRIDPAGFVVQGIVTYGVRVNIDEVDAALRLGMSADVDIQVSVLENALVVPRRAIQRDNTLGEYIVIQTEAGEERVAVVPGYSEGGFIVITGDVTAGQTVVLNPTTP